MKEGGIAAGAKKEQTRQQNPRCLVYKTWKKKLILVGLKDKQKKPIGRRKGQTFKEGNENTQSRSRAERKEKPTSPWMRPVGIERKKVQV